MTVVGYARVSTEDQATARQIDELKLAGCERIFEEHASGGDRARPVLGEVLDGLRQGDTLVVVSLDRLARSLSHLLDVIEELQGRGVFFKSLKDPVDTSSPQGIFTLQVLGAAAQLERALIRERTKSGIKAAVARGKKPGNPALRRRDPQAIKKASAARRNFYLTTLINSASDWLPTVERLRRESHTWDQIVRYLNATNGANASRKWTKDRLMRAVKRLTTEGMANKDILNDIDRKPGPDRLLVIIATMIMSEPNISIRTICTRLEALREKTPKGNDNWQPGSVAHLIQQARKLGLIPDQKDR